MEHVGGGGGANTARCSTGWRGCVDVVYVIIRLHIYRRMSWLHNKVKLWHVRM